jgi:hypothetical protein
MTFPELLEQLRKLPLKEKRFDQPHYLELVILASNLKAAEAVLKQYFGEPLKKSTGEKPEAFQFMESFGGIRSDQNLYFEEGPSYARYVAIWPWSDRNSVTLKIEEVPLKKPLIPRNPEK